jgi:hypothetical protein
MELGQIVEAMKRNMPENSCVGTHNGIQAAQVILVIESRKTEHQLVATHRKDKMSKIPGKRFKSRVMYHNGYIFHRNKIVEKTDTTYFKCSDKVCGATGVKRGIDGEFNRATMRLDRGLITVAEFLSIASNFTYNPARHCGMQPAPNDQPILVARRRCAPPPPTQQIDSDSA